MAWMPRRRSPPAPVSAAPFAAAALAASSCALSCFTSQLPKKKKTAGFSSGSQLSRQQRSQRQKVRLELLHFAAAVDDAETLSKQVLYS